MKNKTFDITTDNGILNLVFKVPSFATRQKLRVIEKKYEAILTIIDKKLDFAKLDLSDLDNDGISKVTDANNSNAMLGLIFKLIPKNPHIIELLQTNLTNEEAELKDKFYLEMFVNIIDVSKLEKDLVKHFNNINIFEDEFIASLDMTEVIIAVSSFRANNK